MGTWMSGESLEEQEWEIQYAHKANSGLRERTSFHVWASATMANNSAQTACWSLCHIKDLMAPYAS